MALSCASGSLTSSTTTESICFGQRRVEVGGTASIFAYYFASTGNCDTSNSPLSYKTLTEGTCLDDGTNSFKVYIGDSTQVAQPWAMVRVQTYSGLACAASATATNDKPFTCVENKRYQAESDGNI